MIASIVAVLLANSIEVFADSQRSALLHCPYVFKDGDNLSKILFEQGIRGNKSAYDLYGKKGWVTLNQIFNPHITDWSRVEIGTSLRLLIPTDLIGECPPPSTPPTVSEVHSDSNVSIPQQTSSSSQKQTQTSAKKKAPKQPRLRKRNPLSIDLRYAKSLEPEGDTLLLPKLSQYSLIIEINPVVITRVRLYIDHMPRSSESFLDENFMIESTRIFLGKAFFWALRPIVDLELSPKIGFWQYESVLPYANDDGVNGQSLQLSRLFSVGVDVTVSRRFGYFSPQIWHGREWTANVLSKKNASNVGQSDRTGFELKIHGPSLSFLSGLYFSGFLMQENTKIKDTTADDLSELRSDGDDFMYKVDYGGIGFGISW